MSVNESYLQEINRQSQHIAILRLLLILGTSQKLRSFIRLKLKGFMHSKIQTEQSHS